MVHGFYVKICLCVNVYYLQSMSIKLCERHKMSRQVFCVSAGCSTLITPESSTAALPWHCSGGWTPVWVTELSGLWARRAPGSTLTIWVTDKAGKSWLLQQSFV